jgi:predicted DNA-binding transcriptional regulator AlpA
MINPFDVIVQKLEAIQSELAELKARPVHVPHNTEQAELLTETQLIKLLAISRTTSIEYRKKGMPYTRQGGRIFYFKEEVFNWLQSRKNNTSNN